MIRKKTSTDGETRESKIISTQDIVLKTDRDTTLDDVLSKQSEDIENLKKWTKWSIKYGGMGTGSGGGGGGSSSTSFRHKVKIRNENSIWEINPPAPVSLNGSGEYVLVVELSKTQGHSFQVYYWKGANTSGKPTGSAFISEGGTSIEIKLGTLVDKFILSYQIKDNNTDDTTDIYSCTVIPNSFLVNYELIRNIDGISIGNKQSGSENSITISALNRGVTAKFNYTIYEKIPLYFKIKYKFELQDDWIESLNEEITNSSDDPLVGELTKTLYWDLFEDRDEYIGQKIEIQLICTAIETGAASDKGSFESTIIPDGYYISLTDGGNSTLYLRDSLIINEDGTVKEGVNMIRKGFLPFYINLYYTSQTEQSINISIDKLTNGVYENSTSETKLLRSNTTYSIASLYGISETDSGTFRITATLQITGAIIKTIKYFHIDENSTNWSYQSYEENFGITTGNLHVYYETNPDPDIKIPVSFYNNSYTSREIVHSSNIVSKQMNESVVLGIQYDASNDDNSPFLKINVAGENGANDIRVYQNKITQGNASNEHYLVGGKDEDGLYFPKTKNSDVTNRSGWHLLHININYVKKGGSGGSIYYCELCVYIDGVLEGIAKTSIESSTTTALDYEFVIKNIIINPENKHILKLNLLDISYIPVPYSEGFVDSRVDGSYTYLYDMYAVNYYNKYRESLGFEVTELDNPADLVQVKDFKFNEYSLPYLEDSGMQNLLENELGVPIVILLPTERTDNPAMSEWFYPIWDEAEDDSRKDLQTRQGRLIYVPENTPFSSEGKISDYIVRDGNSAQTFTFEIQGSSTKSYGVKNIELSIFSSSSGEKKVFTPKFDPSDKKNSFLPEESFTLKADMVDSSACNNNAIGGFINNNIKELDKDNKTVGNFGDYIKSCLIGFPVVVFICPDNIDNTSNVNKYYYVGIYNFNLGRKSNFNLGYYKKEAYDSINSLLDDNSSTSGIKILSVSENDLVINENLCVAEVSNNSQYWDFSQYHSSVLFSDESEPLDADKGMFSDMVGTPTKVRSTLSAAVKSISRAGGYVFESLKKRFIPIGESFDKYGNVCPYMAKKTFTYDGGIQKKFPINGVSDYKVQYRRTLDTYIKIDSSETDTSVADFKEFTDCVGINTAGGDEGTISNVPYLDLRAAVEYYVICQCFGMVDSVQKNLQLKSWGGKTVFPAFYDMDTALGINNSGKSIDYFAFSDYWEVDNSLVDENTFDAKEANIYPDFWDADKGAGFDYPSSYLFALAKYSTMDILGSNSEYLPRTEEDRSLSPVNVYSKYRRTKSGQIEAGDLETAEKFIEKYFIKRLEGIPTTLKNLNVRAKYAKIAYWLIDGFNAQTTSHINGDTKINLSQLTDIEKFQGSGKYKKKDWLTSRLHLLDAYFNLNPSVNYSVMYAEIDEDNKTVAWKPIKHNGDFNYYYPIKEGTSDSFTDATILEQIFPTGQTQGTLNIINLLVKAPRLTPIIFYSSGRVSSYLVGDSAIENYYRLNLNTAGSNVWRFTGSRELQYISNLGLFNISNSSIISDNLREVNYTRDPNGANIEISSITLSTPNVEKINIIGGGGATYSGTLTLAEDKSFNRLNEINLSNTSLILNTDKSFSVKSLNLENMTTSQISLRNIKFEINCEVSLNNAEIGILTLPEWKSEIVLIGKDETVPSEYSDYYKINIKELNLIENSKFSTGSISVKIINMKSLEKITISKNVRHLRLENCEKLKSVTINTYSDSNLTAIENLEILDCSFGISNGEKLSIGTESGTINLTSLGRTGKILLNMKNTRNFEKVTAGNNTINLPTEAFYGCSELKYLENGENGKFCLNGTNTFSECFNFTLTSEESGLSYPKIYALKEDGTVNTNITGTFSLSNGNSKNNIKLNAVLQFLENNKENNISNSILNINTLFLRQQGIGENWDWGKASELGGKLSYYTSIQSCNHSFARCGINYWTKDLFSFGSNSNTITINGGTFWVSTANVTKDFLNNIKSKLITYSDSDPNTGATQNYIVWNSTTASNPLETVVLQNITGGLTKCETLLGLNFPNSGQTIDLYNCFSGSNSLKTISRFLFSGKWINLCWNDTGGERRSCFSELNSLSTLHTSFGRYDDGSGSEKIDLFHLFTIPMWKKININPNSDYSSSFIDTFKAKKFISSENFDILLNTLCNNTNASLTSLNSIFWNCDIINCGSVDYKTIEIPSGSACYRITSLRNLFRNMKAFREDENSEQIPIYIKEEARINKNLIGNDKNAVTFNGFFSNLTGVTSCIYTFSELWLENPPTFNFFKKRKEEISKKEETSASGNNYWQKKTIINSEAGEEDPGKTYVYTVNDSESTPTYSSVDETEKTATELRESQLWSKYQPQFEDIPGYYYWRAELSENNSLINKTLVKNIVSFRVTVKSRTYNKKLSNITGIFRNSIYRNPTFSFPGEKENPEITREDFLNALESFIKDGDNNYYTDYYSDQSCTNKQTFSGSSIEIDDLRLQSDSFGDRTMDLAKGTRTFNTTANITNAFENFEIFNDESNNYYPVISPDFFFGTTDVGSIEYAFSSSESSSNSPKEGQHVLQGFLPEHLISTKNSTAALNNFIQNLNIFPVRIENEENAFVFIPKRFSTKGRVNFDNSFNFNIRIPGNSDTYYLMHSNSLVSTGSSLSGFSFRGGFPQFAKQGRASESIFGVIYPWSTGKEDPADVVSSLNDYNFKYNMIYEDIPFNSIFKGTTYEKFLSSHLIYVLSDNSMWDDNFSMQSLLRSINSTSANNRFIYESLVQYNAQTIRGINKNFKLPKTTANFGAAEFSKFCNGTVGRINKATVGGNSVSYWTNQNVVVVD